VSPTAIRLAPPLILTAEQADAFVEALPAAIDRAALGTTATEAPSAEGGWSAPAGGGR
jgi:acetylornithine aminotransferase